MPLALNTSKRVGKPVRSPFLSNPGEVLILTPPKGWVNQLDHPSQVQPLDMSLLTPYEEPACPQLQGVSKGLLAEFDPLSCCRGPVNLTWISCVASYRFLLTKQGQETVLDILNFSVFFCP